MRIKKYVYIPKVCEYKFEVSIASHKFLKSHNSDTKSNYYLVHTLQNISFGLDLDY